MKAEYKRDLINNYLILEVPEGEQENNYETMMAEKNKIQGLLPFHSVRTDGKWFIYYEITSRIPLSGMYEKRLMKSQDITLILNAISEMLEVLEQYLLSPKQLLFQPDFVYVSPDRKQVEFCFLPGEHGNQVSMLAEFILKHLDHEEPKAVTLGYSLYQHTVEDNFSMHRTLKELLAETKSRGSTFREISFKKEDASNFWEAERAPDRITDKTTDRTTDRISDRISDRIPDRSININPELEEHFGRYENSADDFQQKEHAEKKRRGSKKKGKSEKPEKGMMFGRFHPISVFTFLIAVLTLEILFYYEWIQITEAGGIFFFVAALEILGHNIWKNKNERKEVQEWNEEDDEEFQALKTELYRAPDSDDKEENEEIEETRYLAKNFRGGMYLVCKTANVRGQLFPDIIPAEERWEIGKMKGEVDYVLDSPTVSRRHARIEQLDGDYYLVDQNSKNGTFINGKKLKPQERKLIEEGDVIAFAEIEFQTVKRLHL